ncbi:MAG: hypothetical protein K8L99_08325 [Anaerolineae bacterium]|nr:hypothetical protein [Anaerolineae bacterium]
MVRTLTRTLRSQKITLSPFSASITRHPIFIRDVRRIWWGRSESSLRRYTKRIFWRTQGIVTLVWLGLSIFLLLSAPVYARSLRLLLTQSANALFLLFGIMIVIGLGLDFACVSSASRNMHREIDAQRWDLVRLTALSAPGIALSKHAVVALQSWRAMVAIMAGRVTTLWIALVVQFVLPLLLLGEIFPLRIFLEGFRAEPLQNILMILLFVSVAFVYVAEPLWRMKAMTAVGMMVSIMVRDRSLVTLASFGMIFAIWLLQVIIVISLSLGFSFITPFFFFNSIITFYFVAGLIVIVVALTIRGFYSLLEKWAIRRVIRRIARDK